MIVRQHARRVAFTLHRDMPGVRRVLVARTDGQVFYDDADDTSGQTAAMVAAVLGIGERVCATQALGGFGHSVTRGEDGCLVVYAAGPSHILAVVTEPTVNLVLLDRVVRRLVGGLVTAETGAQPAPVA